MSGVRSIYRGATVKGYATPAGAPIYVDSDDNRLKFIPAGSGTTEVIVQEAGGASSQEILTAARVLTAADSGKVFFLKLAVGFNITLPAPAVGLNYKFYVNIAPTGGAGYTITAAAINTMVGQVYSSTGGDADSTTTFIADLMTFVNDAAVIGDSLDVYSDGVGWYGRGFCNADTGITTTEA
jgi:hypothetical protein